MGKQSDSIHDLQSKTNANIQRQQIEKVVGTRVTDNRPEAIMQRKLQAIANGSTEATQLKLSTIAQQANTIQKQSDLDEEKPLQGKFETAQLVEDEEFLQGKFETIQQVSLEDEEKPVQGKFENIQRVEKEEDKLLQGKFAQSSTIQLQASDSVVQRVHQHEDRMRNRRRFKRSLKTAINRIRLLGAAGPATAAQILIHDEVQYAGQHHGMRNVTVQQLVSDIRQTIATQTALNLTDSDNP